MTMSKSSAPGIAKMKVAGFSSIGALVDEINKNNVMSNNFGVQYISHREALGVLCKMGNIGYTRKNYKHHRIIV